MTLCSSLTTRCLCSIAFQLIHTIVFPWSECGLMNIGSWRWKLIMVIILMFNCFWLCISTLHWWVGHHPWVGLVDFVHYRINTRSFSSYWAIRNSLMTLIISSLMNIPQWKLSLRFYRSSWRLTNIIYFLLIKILHRAFQRT